MRGISAQPQGRIVVVQAGSFRFTKSCRLTSTPRGRFALETARIGHARARGLAPVAVGEDVRGLSAQPQGQTVFPQAGSFWFTKSYRLHSNPRGRFALEAARIGYSRAHFPAVSTRFGPDFWHKLSDFSPNKRQ